MIESDWKKLKKATPERTEQKMASEKRLIDANALLELVQYRLPIDNQNGEVIAGCVEITRRLINNAPTVDAVEVVRCKKCKHRYFNEDIGEYCREVWADGFDTVCTDEEFCSRGERKDK